MYQKQRFVTCNPFEQKKTNNNKNHRNPKTASVKKKLSCHWKIPCCHWEIVLLLYHNVDNDVSHCWILSRRNWMAAYLGYTLADEDAVSWLTSYGSWHAYEKKKNVDITVHSSHVVTEKFCYHSITMWTFQSTVPVLSLRNCVITLITMWTFQSTVQCCYWEIVLSLDHNVDVPVHSSRVVTEKLLSL